MSARVNRMRLYIGRVEPFMYSSLQYPYELGTAKNKWDSIDGFESGAHLASFCSETFEEITGMVLEPGEIRRVRITVEEA